MTSSLPAAIAGQAYSQTLQATGGTPPYTWSVASGPLPTGLNLSSDGVISGTPAAPANLSSFTVQVRDAASQISTRAFNLMVVDVLRIVTSSLPDGNVGLDYSRVLVALGGMAPYTWSLASGSSPLPPGLTVGSSGVVTGIPTSPGTFNPILQVTDSASTRQTRTREVTVLINNRVFVTTLSIPFAVVNQPYSATLQAVGGIRPYTWSVASGALPAGLSLNAATGEINGIPVQPFSGNILIQVTDSSIPPQTSNIAFVTFVVRPALSFVTTTLPDAVRTEPYSGQVRLDGGRPPISLRLSAGSLPPGLRLFPSDPTNGNFFIVDMPTALGQSAFTLEGSDASSPPVVVTRNFTIRVNEPLVFTTSSLPDGLETQPYDVRLLATGGVLPYTWSITPGLPLGLTLDAATGQIAGVPGTAFNGTVFLRVRDSSSPSQLRDRSMTLKIVGKLRMTTSSLPPVKAGAPLQIVPGLTGGTSPFTWSVTTGALPSGLLLDPSTGQISGTPANEATSDFTLRVVDSGIGQFAQSVDRPLQLVARSGGALGRNETPATATPLSNGTYRASISPFADPPSGAPNPDVDVYRLIANPGAIVTVETRAQRLSPPSPLDTVIEIVDANSTRLNLCSPPFSSSGPFNQPCMNDDIDFSTRDSRLAIQVPPGAGSPMTFYVRVLDFRGDARPDFIYTITISGAN